MNIEMHHCMIGEDSLLDAYYEDIGKRARQEAVAYTHLEPAVFLESGKRNTCQYCY